MYFSDAICEINTGFAYFVKRNSEPEYRDTIVLCKTRSIHGFSSGEEQFE
jgi:hypothetical protein